MHICTVTVALAYLCTILHLLMWMFFWSKYVKRAVFCILQDYPWTNVDALIKIKHLNTEFSWLIQNDSSIYYFDKIDNFIREMLCRQYFYNIFKINYKQLVVIKCYGQVKNNLNYKFKLKLITTYHF